MQTHRIVEVKWDTSEGDWDPTPGEIDLPELIAIPAHINEEDIGNWLSDRWGYCHFGWCWWSAKEEAKTMAEVLYSSDPL